ncbi:MAG: hypothetical protein ACI9VR_001250 [Cognaticolwellia sp.]|jgi:hypothetical protein
MALGMPRSRRCTAVPSTARLPAPPTATTPTTPFIRITMRSVTRWTTTVMGRWTLIPGCLETTQTWTMSWTMLAGRTHLPGPRELLRRRIRPRTGKMIHGRRQRSATPQGVRTKECASISKAKNAEEACERKPRMWTVCLIEQPSFSIQSMSTNQAAIESPEPSVSSPFLAKALRCFSSLRMQATRATLLGFPRALRRA